LNANKMVAFSRITYENTTKLPEKPAYETKARFLVCHPGNLWKKIGNEPYDQTLCVILVNFEGGENYNFGEMGAFAQAFRNPEEFALHASGRLRTEDLASFHIETDFFHYSKLGAPGSWLSTDLLLVPLLCLDSLRERLSGVEPELSRALLKKAVQSQLGRIFKAAEAKGKTTLFFDLENLNQYGSYGDLVLTELFSNPNNNNNNSFRAQAEFLGPQQTFSSVLEPTENPEENGSNQSQPDFDEDNPPQTGAQLKLYFILPTSTATTG
jgi:hypothetical protein